MGLQEKKKKFENQFFQIARFKGGVPLNDWRITMGSKGQNEKTLKNYRFYTLLGNL
jgi:hypothetical protein